MHDHVAILDACFARLCKVASASSASLAKPLGIPVGDLIAALARDARFERAPGPGTWWWRLAGTAGAVGAATLADIQAQLSAALRENVALKAELAKLKGESASEGELAQQFAAKGVGYREVLASRGDAATEQLVPGNSRPREAGGWFAAVLRRLDGPQTIGDVAAADQRNLKAASVACAMASKKGLIEQAGKRGRAVLWRLKVAA